MKTSERWGEHNRLIRGFTLVEMMVAIVLSFMAIVVFYKSFVAFAGVAGTQEQTSEMGQNLRVGMDHLAREIRLAGFVRSMRSENVQAGFLVAENDSLRMTRDLRGGGDDGIDNDRDGLVDEADEEDLGDGELDDNYEDIIYLLAGPNTNGSFDLQQLDINGASDTVIENVDALNFVYLDKSGQPLAVPADGANVSTTAPVSRLNEIRSVEITLVVRTTRGDHAYRNSRSYRNNRDSNGDGLNDLIMTGPGDNFHRRVLTTLVKCRNLGL
jgi:type IV pilus assembly protein PilW